MNNQKISIAFGVTVILLMLIFPPFHIQIEGASRNMGYGFILAPPEGAYSTVNIPMLLTQWIGILILTVLAYFLFKEVREQTIDNKNNATNSNSSSQDKLNLESSIDESASAPEEPGFLDANSRASQENMEAEIDKIVQPEKIYSRVETSTMQNLYEAILGEKNRIYYLTKFESFDQQGPGLKASWNWPALLCSGVWALYRKMYGWFFAFWGIAVLSSMFEKAGFLWLSAIYLFVPLMAFTIYADSLYHNSIKKKIAVAQLTMKEEPKLLEYLRYKGGVQTWVIWVFGGLPVIVILAAILIPMFARH